ncbi:MAG: cytochrome c3 family protein [Armatimonadota bacterium]
MTAAPERRFWHQARRAFVVTCFLAALGWLTYRAAYPYPVGPEQPLPFSHRIHAGVREINCFFCHSGADRSPVAGIPEVRKCLLCHNVIAAEFPPIKQLHGYYNRREPVPWVRVYQLPQYVHFNHEMHLAKGVDCRECHGDVKAMDRVSVAYTVDMGFCVDCHRKNGAKVDCTACHY